MRRLPVVFVFAVLTVAAAGCLDDARAVYVPSSVLVSGWSHAVENDTQEAAGGNVDIIVNRYDHGGRYQGNVWGIGVTDVPFVDEAKTLRDEVHANAAQMGVQLEKTGESELQLDNGQTVKRTEYDIRKDTGFGDMEGKAWFLSWDAGFTAGAFGYGTTQASGVLGTEESDALWTEVQGMLRAIDW